MLKRYALLFALAIPLFGQEDSGEEMPESYQSAPLIEEQTLSTPYSTVTPLPPPPLPRTEAIWHHPTITLEALIREYGKEEITYLIPPELGQITLTIEGHRSIPKEVWPDLLDVVLRHKGVFQRNISSDVVEIVLLREHPLVIDQVVTDKKMLEELPRTQSVALLLPLPVQWNQIEGTIGAMAAQQLQIQQIGGGVGAMLLLVGQVEWIQNFCKLLHFVEESGSKQGGVNYKFVHLSHVRAQQLVSWLESVLGIGSLANLPNDPIKLQGAVSYLSFPHYPAVLCLVGNEERVEATSKIIYEVEKELAKEQKKAVFSYCPRHTRVEELASSLERVYHQLMTQDQQETVTPSLSTIPEVDLPNKKIVGEVKPNKSIIDLKTGTLMLVVDPSQVPTLEALAKRLDIPKEMVQVDVILAERRVKENDSNGLNFLELGRGITTRGLKKSEWQASGGQYPAGILKFMLSSRSVNGFSFIYQFLMSEDNVEINSNPSVITLNQTPAIIEILSEQSVNMGTVNNRGREEMRASYIRAEYGIYLTITPTIHGGDELERERYLTLQTEIRFEDVDAATNQEHQPLVIKRKIKNEVRIADGQTVVLGGLKKKQKRLSSEKIPLLGEIPGVGNFFSSKNIQEEENEMIIFLTPHICQNKEKGIQETLEQIYCRPGDFDELITAIKNARKGNEENKKARQPRFVRLFTDGKD